MTDETNYPPKSKVNLPEDAKPKRKAWRRKEKADDEDPPRESGR
jgi:hypothetical protein